MQTTATATGLGAGPYSVFVTDANGCTAIAHDTIKEPSALGIQAIAFNQTVGAPANGSVQLSVTGGSGGNTFAWSNGATTQNLNTLIGGVYTVTVTNNNGCTSTASVTVNAAVATATLANGFGKVELYPNPTAGAFTLNVALTEVRELRAEVYGVTGNAVLTQAAGNTDKQQFQFDLSNLASGMYFVRIVAGGDAQVVKVILEKP